MFSGFFERTMGRLGRDTSGRFIAVNAIVAAALYIIARMACCAADSDMYFLVATGNEILANGIPRVNPWTVEPGIGIVVQQWLYCVVLALADNLGGRACMTAFVAVQVIAMAAVMWRIMRQGSVPRGWSVAAVVLAIICTIDYSVSVRPEVVTLALLFLECLVLEHVRKTDKTGWLFALPVLTAFEMNVHASMWPFHFCILLAYAVPGFWLKGTDNGMAKSLFGHRKAMLVTIFLSLAAMFLNPYGIDGIMYFVRSQMAGTFSFVGISEMDVPVILSRYLVPLYICVPVAVWAWRNGSLTNQSLNMLCGFGLLSVMAIRNYMFLILPLLFLLRDLWAGLSRNGRTGDLERFRCVGVELLLAICVVFALSRAYGVYNTARQSAIGNSSELADELGVVCDYLDRHAEDGDVIFTGFNNGAYLEYRGYGNLYIDARPEIYMKRLNGTKDVLVEYSRYCLVGCTAAYNKKTMPPDWRKPVLSGDMSKWFDSYDFDYVLVVPQSESHLAGYVAGRDDYRVVEDCSNWNLLLYEKVS